MAVGDTASSKMGSQFYGSGPTEIGQPGGAGYPSLSHRVALDMSDTLYKIAPDSAPFLALLSGVQKNPCQTEFGWMMDDNFNIRTFTADLVVAAGGGDALAYLKLRTPSDAQGLEAPPFLTPSSSYDLSEIILYELTADDAGTEYTWWVIFEKSAVEWAGKWRTVDVSASSTVALAVNAAITDPEGYFILIGANVSGVTWNPATGQYWHSDASGTIGNYASMVAGNSNECIGLSPTGGGDDQVDSLVVGGNSAPIKAQAAPGSNAFAAGTYPCKVRVFTPEMMGEGFPEGSGLPEESRKGVTKDENIPQIFKLPYSMTGTAMNISYVGGDEWARTRARKGKEHAINLDQTLMFQGEYDIDNQYSESPQRRTRGLGIGLNGAGTTPFNSKSDIGFIKTHNVDRLIAAGGTTHATNALLVQNSPTTFFDHMDDAVDLIFDDLAVGSDTKVVMGSHKWASIMSKAGREHNSYQWIPGQMNETFGLVVNTFVTPHGTIKFVKHPAFRGWYEDYAVSLDFANIKYRFIPGRDSHIITNAQLPDEDKYKEYWLTECGLECQFEHTHSIMKLYD